MVQKTTALILSFCFSRKRRTVPENRTTHELETRKSLIESKETVQEEKNYLTYGNMSSWFSGIVFGFCVYTAHSDAVMLYANQNQILEFRKQRTSQNY